MPIAPPTKTPSAPSATLPIQIGRISKSTPSPMSPPTGFICGGAARCASADCDDVTPEPLNSPTSPPPVRAIPPALVRLPGTPPLWTRDSDWTCSLPHLGQANADVPPGVDGLDGDARPSRFLPP